MWVLPASYWQSKAFHKQGKRRPRPAEKHIFQFFSFFAWSLAQHRFLAHGFHEKLKQAIASVKKAVWAQNTNSRVSKKNQTRYIAPLKSSVCSQKNNTYQYTYTYYTPSLYTFATHLLSDVIPKNPVPAPSCPPLEQKDAQLSDSEFSPSSQRNASPPPSSRL